MNALCNLYHPFSTGELVVLDMQYSNIKELCNEIKVRHVNGKAVCSDKNNTCIVRECQKQNEIQDREGIRTIWPNLLDDCSNLANTFKKTLFRLCARVMYQDCFSYCGDGSSLSFYLPAVADGEPQALVVWVIYVANAANERLFRDA